MSEIDFLVHVRDAACMVMDACETRLEQLGPAGAKTNIQEEAFLNLKYGEQSSEKLGTFQTADPKQNDVEQFAVAFSILRANGSVINKRFHGRGYTNSYWIFGDKIYRQLLKK